MLFFNVLYCRLHKAYSRLDAACWLYATSPEKTASESELLLQTVDLSTATTGLSDKQTTFSQKPNLK